MRLMVHNSHTHREASMRLMVHNSLLVRYPRTGAQGSTLSVIKLIKLCVQNGRIVEKQVIIPVRKVRFPPGLQACFISVALLRCVSENLGVLIFPSQECAPS